LVVITLPIPRRRHCYRRITGFESLVTLSSEPPRYSAALKRSPIEHSATTAATHERPKGRFARTGVKR
jgi:hypothetical protein